MHVGDTIFIFCLALIIFGPKKLPEIGRQIGKLMVEFRRASNEFKMQIEEELRASEETERQKEINAAKTMLPTAVSPAGITLPELASSVEAAGSSGPVIAPPSTGQPISHSFNPIESTAGTCAYEAIPGPAAEVDAYPEQTNGFNPGLNTASNAENTEDSLAELTAPDSAALSDLTHGVIANLPAANGPAANDLTESGPNDPSGANTHTAVHHG